MRIFLAGATGVIGRRLLPMLVGASHSVTGTTRSAAKADTIARAGGKPAIVDVFEAEALKQVVAAARPDLVIHQLTDLPAVDDPAKAAATRAANSRLRREGTANLVAAAQAAGVTRLIAQSVAFLYAPGPEPHQESDPLAPPDTDSARGVHALENAVSRTPGLEGILLRYGALYGPDTWTATPKGRGALHVDAAARAALLAASKGAPGAYNIAEDDGAVSIDKARRELGFDPGFRLRPPA